MNKLPLAKRVQILSMLCEGSSMRSISRVVDVSINTVDKLLCDAGEAALAYHDKAVRGVKATRVQCVNAGDIIIGGNDVVSGFRQAASRHQPHVPAANHRQFQFCSPF